MACTVSLSLEQAAQYPLLFVIVVTITYTLILTLYRTTVHPLARFPGPKLAAATQWYSFYHDLLIPPGGQFAKHISALHDTYGPIVRISPHELHIRDPEMYETVYTSAVKRDRYAPWAAIGGSPASTFATVEHDQHRRRRVATNPMMIRKKINEAMPLFRSRIDALLALLQRAADSSEVLDLDVAILGFTMDTAADFLFRRELGVQNDLELAKQWSQVAKSMSKTAPLTKQFPALQKMLEHLPPKVMTAMFPDARVIVDFQATVSGWAEEFLADQRKRRQAIGGSTKPETLFEAILCSKLPAEEKTVKRLMSEGMAFVVAGSETTARVLCRAVYELCCARDTMVRVKQELASAGREAVGSWTELEKLPFLSAVIKETLRISSVVQSRLPVQLHEPLRYKDFVIPAMTPISLSPVDIHYDPAVFPDPHTFEPDRWLLSTSNRLVLDTKLDKYLLPFGRGSRGCQGATFAWAEMYPALAALLWNFDFELFDVVRERDIDYVGDFFLGSTNKDSRGVRVIVSKGRTAEGS